MLGGAADLVESTKTEFVGGGLFSRTQSGRNIAFGIREHAMGSIVNGLAVHGGIASPYGSTFFIFSDYMRPAVRLSALMGLPVVWAWTHDSVALGEDGPTHQPIEQLAALRAIPNLWMIRPADANETAVAWKVALERTDGPVGLALSREKVPTLDRSDLAPASGLARGAYALWDSGDGEPDLILIGTGPQVGLALEAAKKIAEGGTAVRVVSMPCWELFAAEAQEYRDEVLPPGVAARLAIEPGVELGWHRWVGDRGGVVGLERFGESAPGTEVLERLGYTVDNVVARATALLERVS
jgi:transketolase